MKIIIARHAETTENAKTQDLGHDGKAMLTEKGILQAKKLGKHLKGHKITHAYTSPQIRAIDTAKHVLEHHVTAKMEHIDHLKEQNLGIYETAPKHVWKEAKKNAKEPFHLFKPEEGESYADVQARAATFFDSLLKKHKDDDTLLVVSHGGTTGMLLLHLLEKEITEENYKAHKPENTAVTMVEISKEGKVEVKTINSLEHLIAEDEEI